MLSNNAIGAKFSAIGAKSRLNCASSHGGNLYYLQTHTATWLIRCDKTTPVALNFRVIADVIPCCAIDGTHQLDVISYFVVRRAFLILGIDNFLFYL